MTLRLLALLAVVVGLQPTAFVAAEAVAADLQFAAFAATAIGGGGNETSSFPDSVLTEEQVYLHLFTDRSLSERIMSEMRRRGILPDWELDYLEGDLYYNTGHSREALKFYSSALASRRRRRPAADGTAAPPDLLL